MLNVWDKKLKVRLENNLISKEWLKNVDRALIIADKIYI